MKNPRLNTLTRSDIETTAQHLQPDPLRLWACRAGEKWFPVKQLVQKAANRLEMPTVPRVTPADFTSHQGVKLLRDLGLEMRYLDGDEPFETNTTEPSETTCPILHWLVIQYAKVGDWITLEEPTTGLKYRVHGSAVAVDSKDRLTDDGRGRLRRWLEENQPSGSDPRVTDFPMLTVGRIEEIGLRLLEKRGGGAGG